MPSPSEQQEEAPAVDTEGSNTTTPPPAANSDTDTGINNTSSETSTPAAASSSTMENNSTPIFGTRYSNENSTPPSFSDLASSGYSFGVNVNTSDNTTHDFISSAGSTLHVRGRSRSSFDNDESSNGSSQDIDDIMGDSDGSDNGGRLDGGATASLANMFGATTMTDTGASTFASSPWSSPSPSGGQQLAQSIITGFEGFDSGPAPAPASGDQVPPSVITGFEGFPFNQSTTSTPTNSMSGTAAQQYHATNYTDQSTGWNMVLQCITAMPFYENRSMEELRLEDYQHGNRGENHEASSGFVSPPESGTLVWQYHPTNCPDLHNIPVTMHAITAMPFYSNKSFEELRWEDYLAGNKGQGGQRTTQPVQSNRSNSATIAATPDSSCLLDTNNFEKNIKGKTVEDLETLEKNLTESLDLVKKEKEKAIKKRLHNEEQKHVCVVCLTEPKCVLLMPCQHLCVCKDCSMRGELNKCPLCRKYVHQKMDVYF